MKLLFELSGEHSTLPAAEAEACLKIFGINPICIAKQHVFVVEAALDSPDVQALGHRLALSHAIYEVLSSGSLQEIEHAINAIDFGTASTFSLQGRRFGAHIPISYLKKHLGTYIQQETGLQVDLATPDMTLYILSDVQIYLCRQRVVVNRSQFEQRKPQYRPFSSPVSLNPRIARALVNLVRITPGQILMDPFCGTGGILIEAGLLGAQVVGIDIKNTMVEGCRANLTHYGITPDHLQCGDALAIDGIYPVDAVVTDLPYGRSTSITTSPATLYKDAFSKLGDWLKPTGMAVVGLPEKRFISLAEQQCSVIEVHPMRVHRSLTRYFCVLRPD